MPQKTSNCFQNKRNYYYFFFFSGFRFFEIYNATVAALETPKKFPKSSQILETFLSGDSSGHVTSRHVTYLASVSFMKPPSIFMFPFSLGIFACIKNIVSKNSATMRMKFKTMKN